MTVPISESMSDNEHAGATPPKEPGETANENPADDGNARAFEAALVGADAGDEEAIAAVKRVVEGTCVAENYIVAGGGRVIRWSRSNP